MRRVHSLLLGTLLHLAIAETLPVELVPNVALLRQELDFDGPGTVFELNQLEPSRQYEVRLSYPATIPAFIDFTWETGRSTRLQRRLLNLEKIQFYADAAGNGPGLLRLRARREGYHRDGPGAGHTVLVYNIELGRTIAGVPVVAFPVACYVLAGTMMILLFLPRLQTRVVPWLVDWITAGR